MSNIVDVFDKWFKILSEEQQLEIIKHIQMESLKKGIFCGPINDGLNTGPISYSSRPKVCPTCRKPY